MSFQRVAIVGHGLIGGSIALALGERHPSVRVIPIDRDEPLEAAADADLIVLSAPVRANLENVRRLQPLLSKGAIVTDTGSTKSAIVDAAAGLRFIGGHPIAGLAESGRGVARANLFAGHHWILTPSAATAAKDVEAVDEFVTSLGAIPARMSATEHDRVFAYISHLPQLSISALMHVVGQSVGRDGLAFAGPGLRDSTRLATSLPDIWREIAAENRDNLSAAIDALIKTLQRLRNDVSGEEVTEIFESARRAKAALDSH